MDWLTEFPEMGRRDMRDFRKGIDQGFKDFTRTHGEDIESFFEPLLQFLIWLEKTIIGNSLASIYRHRLCLSLVRKSQSENRHRLSNQFIPHWLSRNVGRHDEYCQYHCRLHMLCIGLGTAHWYFDVEIKQGAGDRHPCPRCHADDPEFCVFHSSGDAVGISVKFRA